MSTNIGKFSILNPADKVSIADTNWVKTNIEGRIKSRIDLYVKNVLLSDDVLTRRENIVKEIQSFQGQKAFCVEAIKSDAIDINPLNDKETESFIYFIQPLLLFYSSIILSHYKENWSASVLMTKEFCHIFTTCYHVRP